MKQCQRKTNIVKIHLLLTNAKIIALTYTIKKKIKKIFKKYHIGGFSISLMLPISINLFIIVKVLYSSWGV